MYAAELRAKLTHLLLDVSPFKVDTWEDQFEFVGTRQQIEAARLLEEELYERP